MEEKDHYIESSNQRIAKNTMLLYIRMLFTMAVSLYTSRIVLNTLGVEDFGIFNVVGGIVAMFGFVQGSMAAATQRYLTFSLGQDDDKRLREVFSTSVIIHVAISILIVLLAETAGLWFLHCKMQIPENRMTAAFWVYQCSIISLVVMFISIPYNAVIIAHEKMSAFAYISVLEVVLKLLIVYALVISPMDKLILYALLFALVQLVIRFCYSIYCGKHFNESKFHWVWDKPLMKEMFAFMGWTLNGNLAVVGYTQGLNVVLNLFFGPTVNAARGVAVQVQGAVQRFCTSFQMAVNPQLTKSYAQGDHVNMHRLIDLSSRFSFFLLLFLSLPVMFETRLILSWWLGVVPVHTENFLRLILLSNMTVALSNPIVVSVHATGRIRRFQLIEGSMLLLIIPIAYILLRVWSVPPESVFVVHLVVELLTQYVRLRIVLPMIGMRMGDYFRRTVCPIMLVVATAPILPFLCYRTIPHGSNSFLIVCITCVLSVLFAVYMLGSHRAERIFVMRTIEKKVRRYLYHK